MKPFFYCFCLIGLLLGGMPSMTYGQVPPEEVAKIEAALPEAPRVEPEQPRRVLIYTRSMGFRHSAIPYGAYALARLGEKSGAFTFVLSEDTSMFEPEMLATFDAVVLDNNTGRWLLPAPPEQLSEAQLAVAEAREARLKASLLEYVRNGGGVMGIHAATDSYYDWAEFGEMIGGYFDGHPWNEEVGIKLEEPEHPLVAAFEGDFTIADEIYQFRGPYSRENLRVLLALDPETTDMEKEGMKREDGDYAVTWVNQYGEGRVFYCSLGHRHEVFWNPAVLQHFLDGIQFATGDLEADATPSVSVEQE